MKKILFLLLMSCITLCTQAQSLQEVRGIETKISIKDYNDNNNDYYYCVTFTNQNSFPVSVDAEFWANYDKGSTIIATKQFEMAPKETYIWYTDKRSVIMDAYVKYKAYKSPNLVTE